MALKQGKKRVVFEPPKADNESPFDLYRRKQRNSVRSKRSDTHTFRDSNALVNMADIDEEDSSEENYNSKINWDNQF